MGGAGPWLLAAVIAYHGGSSAVTWQRDHHEWGATWRFAAILSVWMVLPDAVLVGGLGVLRFPPDGVPDLLGGPRRGYLAAVLTALVVCGGAEATLTLVRCGSRSA